MTRLIDADYLLKELEDWQADLDDAIPDRQLGVTDAIVIACQMPTVDAIPIEWVEEWLMSQDLYYVQLAINKMIDAFRTERKANEID